jgi:hypothetical protein
VVSFQSDTGDFERLFVAQGAGDVLLDYKANAGLFSWLRPKDPVNGSWDEGSCEGYGERQRDVFADNTFEAVRFLAIFAVLLSIGLTLWVVCMLCISMSTCQIWIFSGMHLLVCILVSLLFLLKKSGLCENVGQNSKCSLSDAGLVCIAAAILWFATFLISATYVRAPETATMMGASAQSLRQAEERRRRREERRRKREAEKESRREDELIKSIETPEKARAESIPESQTPETAVSVELEGPEGEMEICMVKTALDNIEDIVDDRV